MMEINLLRDIDKRPRFENNSLYVLCYKVPGTTWPGVSSTTWPGVLPDNDDYAILSVYIKRHSKWLHTIIYPYRRKFTCGNASS